MKLSKRNMLYVCAGLVCLLIIILLSVTSDWRTRRSLKSQCMPGGGMDCACFANIIDNRLSDEEVRIFARFSKELRNRPHTNILEFTDEVIARKISLAVSVCRPVQQVPQETKNQKGKK
ncbi:MAG: hypothetical protein J5613_00090 [Alphaproteobacteria bacterium]|nr:hypothetical protein [Alphaproteobacteria bacterium]